jgi:hypothetical protein
MVMGKGTWLLPSHPFFPFPLFEFWHSSSAWLYWVPFLWDTEETCKFRGAKKGPFHTSLLQLNARATVL